MSQRLDFEAQVGDDGSNKLGDDGNDHDDDDHINNVEVNVHSSNR